MKDPAVTTRVLVLTMPFFHPRYPDIQSGKVSSLLKDSPEVEVTTRYANIDLYQEIGSSSYDWVVDQDVQESLHDLIAVSRDTQLFKSIKHASSGLSKDHHEFESLSLKYAQWSEPISDEISKGRYEYIIFSCRYKNFGPSLALAKNILVSSSQMGNKSKLIICGDYVEDRAIQEEIERLAIFDHVVLHKSLDETANAVANIVTDDKARRVECPTPDYSEYFSQKPNEFEKIYLTEASDKCWWYNCKFCSSRGFARGVKQRGAEKIVGEIVKAAAAHSVTNFEFTDVCLSPKLLRGLAAGLSSYDFNIFCEIKFPLTKQNVNCMSQAGIRAVQVGVESFSDSILQRIDKGNSVLDAVYGLKLLHHFEIRATYNLMYGFPEETEDELLATIAVATLISHLPPPENIIRMRLELGSEYYRSYTNSGELQSSPAAALGRYADNPWGAENKPLVSELKKVVLSWMHTRERFLTLRQGPDFVEVRDFRQEKLKIFTFPEPFAGVLVHLDAPRTRLDLEAFMHGKDSHEVSRLDEFLEECLSLGLVIRSMDSYLNIVNTEKRRSR
ncbi:radical SAM protein [Roseovarius tibetensis]|uniref:radical SAM protein n=1 Tax=Roseovarius tibetensis TaxID=2685897 RepID=UPI003D7FAD85